MAYNRTPFTTQLEKIKTHVVSDNMESKVKILLQKRISTINMC